MVRATDGNTVRKVNTLDSTNTPTNCPTTHRRCAPALAPLKFAPCKIAFVKVIAQLGEIDKISKPDKVAL